MNQYKKTFQRVFDLVPLFVVIAAVAVTSSIFLIVGSERCDKIFRRNT